MFLTLVIFLSIFRYISTTIQDGAAFFALMFLFGLFAFVFSVVAYAKIVPGYTFLLGDTEIKIITSKKLRQADLSDSGSRKNRFVKQEITGFVIKGATRNGNLDLIFMGLKTNEIVIPYANISAVFIQPSWNTKLFRATNIYLLYKNKPIELNYINKNKIGEIRNLLVGKGMDVQVEEKSFIFVPDFLKNKIV